VPGDTKGDAPCDGMEDPSDCPYNFFRTFLSSSRLCRRHQFHALLGFMLHSNHTDIDSKLLGCSCSDHTFRLLLPSPRNRYIG
jgi:hypothetical protein